VARALTLTLARGGVALVTDPGRVAAPAFVESAASLGLQVAEPEVAPIDADGAAQTIRVYRVRSR
jgi:hypothetical protein